MDENSKRWEFTPEQLEALAIFGISFAKEDSLSKGRKILGSFAQGKEQGYEEGYNKGYQDGERDALVRKQPGEW